MTEEERKRLAVVAANVHTRWALRTNTYLVAAPDADGWREIAAAVAAEVRQQDRAKLERRRDAYWTQYDANPNAYWADLANAFEEAIAILSGEKDA